MVHRIDAKGRLGRLGALTGVVLALSFVFVSAMAGQHTHTDTAESPAACAVCASTQQAPITTAPTQLEIVVLDVHAWASRLGSTQPVRSTLWQADRSRAPPTRPSL